MQGPPLRLLVVDDDVDSLEQLGETLTMLGHWVTLAHGGQQALALVSDELDAAIVDLQMPDVSGFDLAQELRGRGIHVRLVALSGRDVLAERTACVAAGFDGYAIKPVTIEGLMRILRGEETVDPS